MELYKLKDIPKCITKDSKLFKAWKENDENDDGEILVDDRHICEDFDIKSLDDFIIIMELSKFWCKDKIPYEIWEYGYQNKLEVCRYLMSIETNISNDYSNIEFAFKIASERWDEDISNDDKFDQITLVILIWHKINEIECLRVNALNEINKLKYRDELNKFIKLSNFTYSKFRDPLNFPKREFLFLRNFPSATWGFFLKYKTIALKVYSSYKFNNFRFSDEEESKFKSFFCSFPINFLELDIHNTKLSLRLNPY